MPTTKMTEADFAGDGIGVLELLSRIGLAASNSDARRTVEQGGLTVAGEKITDPKTWAKASWNSCRRRIRM